MLKGHMEIPNFIGGSQPLKSELFDFYNEQVLETSFSPQTPDTDAFRRDSQRNYFNRCRLDSTGCRIYKSEFSSGFRELKSFVSKRIEFRVKV